MDGYFVIIVTLLLSAFFSASEMAFISAGKLHVELNSQRGGVRGRLVGWMHENPGMFSSTMLIGNTISIVVLVLFVSDEISSMTFGLWPEIIITLTQILSSTLIVVLLAEFLPKIVGRLKPVAVLNRASVPLMLFYVVFYPLAFLAQYLVSFFTNKIFNFPKGPRKESIEISPEDIDYFISENPGKIDSINSNGAEMKFFRNAIELPDIKVRECLVPRTDLEAIDIAGDHDTLKERFIDTGFSKILVYQENIDNIIGYVHVSSMFTHPELTSNIIKPVTRVPETMPAVKLLEIFKKTRESIVLVVDEFGGTSGIVTTEDLLEEIFGEIDDEHDVSDLVERQIANGVFQFSGRLEIDYLNERYNLNIPESENYETLAGFLLFHHEAIPVTGDEILAGHFKCKIIDASKSRINTVQVMVIE